MLERSSVRAEQHLPEHQQQTCADACTQPKDLIITSKGGGPFAAMTQCYYNLLKSVSDLLTEGKDSRNVLVQDIRGK